jgi:hypothetical protein
MVPRGLQGSEQEAERQEAERQEAERQEAWSGVADKEKRRVNRSKHDQK